MKVELIEYTYSPDKLSALAAWSCHRETIPEMEEMDEETTENVLDSALSSGHVGVTEHVSFTFAVEGVSRVLTHQLVRHRIATYDQQSQRVVDAESFDYIVPESIKNSDYCDTFISMMSKLKELYSNMQDNDIPNEDARFILPNATTSNVVVTMNARILNHFFKLRCCRRAQWEIRELAWRMLKICKEKAPKIFEEAGPSCLFEDCPEGEHSCNNPYTPQEQTEIFEKIEKNDSKHLFGNSGDKE